MIYLTLALEFFKIGLFAIGGGLASLPFLYDMSDKYGWFSYSELVDMIAISESTPGPLGANMATYVGYHVGTMEFGALGGILGSLVATISLIIPSIVITVCICKFLSKFMNNQYVQWAFYGLRPAVAGLIMAIAFSLLQMALFGEHFTGWAALDWKALILLVIFLPAVFLGKKHPILYIGVAAVIGMIFKF